MNVLKQTQQQKTCLKYKWNNEKNYFFIADPDDLPIEFYEKNSIGYITARLIDDTAALEGIMLNNIISGIVAIFEIFIIFF